MWFALLGFSAAYTPVLIAHGKALFPPGLIGRGMSLLNIGSMGGVFVSQTATGAAIDLRPATTSGGYPMVAYRTIFGVQAAFIGLACLFYLSARVTRGGSRTLRRIA